MRRYFREKLWLFGMSSIFMFLAGCAVSNAAPSEWESALKKREEKLGTAEESLAIYHYVVANPRGGDSKLEFEGYLIGIEKADVEKIGTQRGLDPARFRKKQDLPAKWKDNKGRIEHLERVTDDGKKMFVSHLVAYDAQAGAQGVKSRFVHSAYPAHPDFPIGRWKECPPIARDSKYYERGWDAMEVLRCELEDKFQDARNQRDPYTHLIVISMGWNNDQEESIRRYNLIFKYLKKAQLGDNPPGRFRPMVIAFSWPSVWAGESRSWLVRKFLHLASYGNKSDDADEIGYTYANYLVNGILPGLKAGNPPAAPKIVLIGHSMGARLLSRAAFSAPLLKNPPADNITNFDLVAGLQGAFSVNRFVKGHKLPFPLSLLRTGEGYPYSDHASAPGKLVMTWSKHDLANPFAVALTGAKHIGGILGYQESLEEGKRNNFSQVMWNYKESMGKGVWKRKLEDGSGGGELACARMADEKKVLMVDASSFVKKVEKEAEKDIGGHNDILDEDMGRFLWDSFKCFAK